MQPWNPRPSQVISLYKSHETCIEKVTAVIPNIQIELRIKFFQLGPRVVIAWASPISASTVKLKQLMPACPCWVKSFSDEENSFSFYKVYDWSISGRYLSLEFI